MKLSAALSFVLIGLLTSAHVFPTALGNFSVAVTEHQRAGVYLKGAARATFLNDRDDEPNIVTLPMPWGRGKPGTYVVEIGYGEPVKPAWLAVDTGSSITWWQDYTESSTTQPTGRTFNLKYDVDGFCRADEFLDQVAIAPDLVITDQAIGAAFDLSDFGGNDGILGLGPVALTKGTIPSDRDAKIPTVMNKLKEQKLISNEVFSIYFPSTAYSGVDDEGKLIFGGIDESLYEGEMRYIALTEKRRASKYWGVNIDSCTYGENVVIWKSNGPKDIVAGIIDSGAGLIYLADDLFYAYMTAIPDTRYHYDSGLLEIPSDSIKYMQPLRFQIGDHVFTLDVDDQLLPLEANEGLEGDPGKQYGFITTLGARTRRSRSGFDFVLGVPFMKLYYTVFDTDNQRLGFAKASPQEAEDLQPQTDKRS